jgi:hypothetical protein
VGMRALFAPIGKVVWYHLFLCVCVGGEEQLGIFQIEYSDICWRLTVMIFLGVEVGWRFEHRVQACKAGALWLEPYLWSVFL